MTATREPRPRTDLGNAERLADQHGETIRYCFAWRSWLVWDGTRWATGPDAIGSVMEMAKATVRTIYAEAAKAEDRTERDEITKHARRSESSKSLKAMIELAQSAVPVTPDQLDTDPLLFNVANGTLDLRTGHLRDHRRDDLITKRSPVDYDPAAEASVWFKFLDRIMAEDEVMIGFLQRAVGYSMLGVIRDQVMFLLYGTGANGKSKLLEAVHRVMGDYGQAVPRQTLMAKRDGGGIPNDVARLRGARFAMAIETDREGKLDESLIKSMTGGDRMVARFMRAEYFEFDPSHKPWLATNHKPGVSGTDHGIWRRLLLVPFTVQIPDEEQDQQLPEKLAGELPGILRWMAEGCMTYQRDGLRPPEKVIAATAGWRTGENAVGRFLEERCITKGAIDDDGNEIRVDDLKTGATALWEAFEKWAAANGEESLSTKALKSAMEEMGYQSARSRAGVRWLQVGLRETNWSAPWS